MKKIVFIFCLTSVSFFSFAQTEDETAIRNAMNEQVNAWNSGNISAFMQTYWQSDSLLFVGSLKPTYGWQTTLDNYKKNYPDTASMGTLSFNIVTIKKLSPEYFYVVGKWMLKRTIGNVEGHFDLLFRKIRGRWYIIADHSS